MVIFGRHIEAWTKVVIIFIKGVIRSLKSPKSVIGFYKLCGALFSHKQVKYDGSLLRQVSLSTKSCQSREQSSSLRTTLLDSSTGYMQMTLMRMFNPFCVKIYGWAVCQDLVRDWWIEVLISLQSWILQSSILSDSPGSIHSSKNSFLKSRN